MMAELLSFGHSYEAVMEDYSIDELALHYEAMVRTQAKATKHQATMFRAAMHADKRGWREFRKMLDGVWRDIELAAGRSVSNAGTFFDALDKKLAAKKRRGH